MNKLVLMLLTFAVVLSLCGGCKQKQQAIPDPLYEVGDRVHIARRSAANGQASIVRVLHYSPEKFGWYYEVKFRNPSSQSRELIHHEGRIRRGWPKLDDKPAKPSLSHG